SATGLPGGLSINAGTGAITGTPNASGTFSNVVVTVTDSTTGTHLTANKTFTIVINPALAITTASPLATGAVGVAYSAQVDATGGVTPYSWSATGVPGGLSINAGTGAITGTPTAAGTFSNVVVTVTDSTTGTHLTANKTFTIVINTALSITTASPLSAATVGASYNAPVAATGGVTPYSWSATGLPGGLSINAGTGAISGTPTAAGTFSNVVVTVTDSTTGTHLTANKTFTITVNAAPSITTASPLPGGTRGVAYNTTIVATGGTAPLSWSATGLPGGLSINAGTGAITGTPNASGTFSSVQITVTDANQASASKTFSITIAGLTITTTALPPGLAGSSYDFTPAATGGTAPLTWSIAPLPRNLSADGSGRITGIPLFPGTSQVTLDVTDSSTPPQHTSKTLSLVVQPAPLSITNTSLPDATLNILYSAPLTGTGGLTPYMWTAVGLPAGLTLDAGSGIISGIPTVAGTSQVSITLTDSDTPNKTFSKTLTLNVNLGQGGQGQIIVDSATVGQNLQKAIAITLNPPPPIDTVITITTDTPGSVLLGSSLDGGAAQLQATVTAGTTSVGTFVKALTGAGTSAKIKASIAGYADGIGTITLANSGFVIAASNGIGGNFDTFKGVVTTLTVFPARLSSSGIFVESEQLRGGFSISVPISVTNGLVGSVSPPSLSFPGGADSMTASFNASTVNAGLTTINVGEPFPFMQPATGASLQANVQSGGIIPPSGVTLGKGLQTNLSVQLTGPAPSTVTVTVTSLDPNRLVFSNTATGLGATTITMTIPQNQRFSPDFYARGLDGSGSVGYTIAATGFGSLQTNMPLGPSGLVVQTPAGFNTDFTLTGTAGNAALNIYTAVFDSAGNPLATEPLISGSSITVAVSSAPSSVGTITNPSVTITGPDTFGTTQFHPVATGTATINATAPGYLPSTVHGTVQQAKMNIDDHLVGKGLQEQGTLILGAPAPSPNGVDVTIQSNSPSLKLSTSATAAGTSSILIHLNAGEFLATYFVQAFDSTGQGTYTASASGYGNGQGTVTFAPSGIVILGPNQCIACSFSVAGGAQQLTVFTALLNGTSPVAPQALAGGTSVSVTLHNSTPAAGALGSSTVTITGGNQSNVVTFTPAAPGGTQVSVDQPTGYTTPSSLTLVGITVTP
ncbi:MAG TPA: Ig domain-containing protein, partial [Bryobacteraceae bacterium]